MERISKNCLALVTCIFLTTSLFAQSSDPVKWTFSAKKLADKIYEIHITAIIEPDWHIYSQTTPEGGPARTAIDFAKNPLASLQGEVKEIGKMEEHFEELFGVQVRQFSDKVDFVQRIVLSAKAKTAISGSVEFMSCNDHECHPRATRKFSITLK